MILRNQSVYYTICYSIMSTFTHNLLELSFLTIN